MTDDDGNPNRLEEPDPISDLALKRRADAERESSEPLPDFVTSVEQSEVVYTLDPTAMPYAAVDPLELCRELTTRYGVNLSPPDYSPLLRKLSRENLSQMSDDEALTLLVQEPGSGIRFESGKFTLRGDFVPIRQISANYESIHVTVAGVTSVAVAVAQDVLELMWQIAGSNKRWDQDLKPHLMTEGYGTATRVQLPGPPESLVNPAIMEAVAGEMNRNNGAIAKKMGRFNDSTLGNEILCRTFFDDLTIRISKYSPWNGNSDTSDLVFSVTARSDYGTGRMRVTSELHYDDHVALLRTLFSAITP